MKVIIDRYNEKDIEIIEYLEPQSTFYSIKQGDSEINFNNTYEIKELIKALTFIIS